MFSERGLARGHTNLWLNCAPRLNEQLINRLHQSPSELISKNFWALPHEGNAPSKHNDVIAEVAFGIFNYSVEKQSSRIEDISFKNTDLIIQLAIQQLAVIRGGTGFPREWFSADHLEDATLLASRLFEQLQNNQEQILVHPRLEGLGMLASCHPDIIQGRQLIEVKMSKYGFRTQDLRQLIVYALLAWYQGIEIDTLTLINPRLGITWQFTVDNLAFLVSNDSHAVLFQQLQEYLTGDSIDRWV
jgi:hypothetical protein